MFTSETPAVVDLFMVNSVTAVQIRQTVGVRAASSAQRDIMIRMWCHLSSHHCRSRGLGGWSKQSTAMSILAVARQLTCCGSQTSL